MRKEIFLRSRDGFGKDFAKRENGNGLRLYFLVNAGGVC